MWERFDQNEKKPLRNTRKEENIFQKIDVYTMDEYTFGFQIIEKPHTYWKIITLKRPHVVCIL